MSLQVKALRKVAHVNHLTNISPYNQGTTWTQKKPFDILKLLGSGVKGTSSQTAASGLLWDYHQEVFDSYFHFLNKMKVICLQGQEIQTVQKGTK